MSSEIWTDGSCLGNPGPGGWAAVIIDGRNFALVGGEVETTNNRMELMAVVVALEALHPDHVKVFTDSEYVLKVASPTRKKIKANRDLVAQLDAALAKHHCVEFKHVSAHSGIERNEQSHKLARAEAERQRSKATWHTAELVAYYDEDGCCAVSHITIDGDTQEILDKKYLSHTVVEFEADGWSLVSQYNPTAGVFVVRLVKPK